MTHSNYTTDANAIKSALQVRDAVRKGGKGVAIFFADDGSPTQVVPLGGAQATVREPTDEEARRAEELGWTRSYAQVSGEEWERSVAESHEHSNRMGNRFPPQVKLGAGDKAAADAARIEKERKDRQAKMAADAREFNKQQFARNERIAAAGKAAIEKMWPKKSPVGFSRGR